MPAPYTDAEQDTLIDGLVALVATQGDLIAALTTRIDDQDTLIASMGADISALGVDTSSLSGRVDDLEEGAEETETAFGGFGGRLNEIEDRSIPSIERLARGRQENDTENLDKPGVVTKAVTKVVRRPNGRMAQVVIRPR